MSWNITYQRLDSDVTMAHFHGVGTRREERPVQVWLTKKGGTLPPSGSIKGSATLTAAQAKMFMAAAIRDQVIPPKSA